MTKLMVVCALIASFFVLPGVCQARKEILDLNFPESPSIQGQMMNISKKCSGLVLNSIRFTTTHNSIQNAQALKISFIKD